MMARRHPGRVPPSPTHGVADGEGRRVPTAEGDDELATVREVQERLLATVPPLEAVEVPLEEAAGRILAEPIVAAHDLPPFDNSAMDGYAVRAADVENPPVVLPVVAAVYPGEAPLRLPPGCAVRIATGAAIPPGADAVVRQEDTERRGDRVVIRVPAAPGTAVRRRGEDVAAGRVLLHPGHRMRSVDVAVAAAAGYRTLLVGRRPRVAVVAGGDELVAPGDLLGPFQVTDCNSPMLVNAVRDAGGEPLFLGIAKDRPGALRELLDRAPEVECVVSSAGVSVGDRDYVAEVVAALGTVQSWRVALRPGKPLLVGRVGGAVFVGLPGNPVSAAVTFELFVRPVLLRLQGAARPFPRRLRARLAADVAKPASLQTLVRACLVDGGADADLPLAFPSPHQGSAMVGSLATVDCLLDLEAEGRRVAAGSVVEAILLS